LMRGLLALQPRQLLLRTLNLSNTRVSVFPEVEEFLVVPYGFCFVVFHKIANQMIDLILSGFINFLNSA